MSPQWQRYKELELISDSPLRLTPQRQRSPGQFFRSLLQILCAPPKFRIRQFSNRAGQSQWVIYDVATGRSFHLESGEAVRLWLRLHESLPESGQQSSR